MKMVSLTGYTKLKQKENYVFIYLQIILIKFTYIGNEILSTKTFQDVSVK